MQISVYNLPYYGGPKTLGQHTELKNLLLHFLFIHQFISVGHHFV